MGLIGDLLAVLFGGNRNILKQTAEFFRPNSEAQAIRDALGRSDALSQFASEFLVKDRGRFDRLMDAINRLPRPLLAFGTLGLFVSAMANPVWFAQRMQGVALVPEPLWWLMGVIVSFYFGARYQSKTQEFQRSLAAVISRTPTVARNIRDLDTLFQRDDIDVNEALNDWKHRDGR